MDTIKGLDIVSPDLGSYSLCATWPQPAIVRICSMVSQCTTGQKTQSEPQRARPTSNCFKVTPRYFRALTNSPAFSSASSAQPPQIPRYCRSFACTPLPLSALTPRSAGVDKMNPSGKLTPSLAIVVAPPSSILLETSSPSLRWSTAPTGSAGTGTVF